MFRSSDKNNRAQPLYVKLVYIYTYVQFHKRRTYTCILEYIYIYVHFVVIVKMNCVLMQKSGHAQNQAEMSKTCVLKCKVICACCKKLCYKNDPPQATNLRCIYTTDVSIYIYIHIYIHNNFVDKVIYLYI